MQLLRRLDFDLILLILGFNRIGRATIGCFLEVIAFTVV